MERHAAPRLTRTPRLRLEPIGPEHHAGLLRLLSDARVGATLGGTRDAADVDAWIARDRERWERDGFGLWAALDPATGELLARGGLARTHVGGRDEVEVAWAVVPERWGEGLATELGVAALALAGDLRIPSVVAFTLPHNAASRRVMAKLRFVHERDVLHAGEPHVLYRRELAPARG